MAKTSTKRPTIRQRAQAIIRDSRRYDEETRHSVQNALQNGASGLAECVRRAEAGETILDIVNPLPGHQPPVKTQAYHKAAEHVVALLTDPETPYDLRDAIEDYIVELENCTQVNVYTPEVAQVALPLMFEVYDALNLRKNRLTRPEKTRDYLRAKREARGKGGES